MAFNPKIEYKPLSGTLLLAEYLVCRILNENR